MPQPIVLINPSFQKRVRRIAQTTVGPPLGLAYLAGAARRAGHPVRIVDANAHGLSVEQAAVEALKSSPALVGITATTPTVKLAGEIAAAVKLRAPSVVTIVGGPHTTFLPERTLHELPAVDIAARGEADVSLPRLLAAMDDAGEGGPSLVEGFVFRRRDGTIQDGGPPAPVDLATLPEPAFDLLPMGLYRCPDSDTFSTLLAMRGCPYPCIYCAVPSVFGRRIRYRPARDVASEMQRVHHRHGVDFFAFVDDTFTTSGEWVRAFCEEVEARGLHERARWVCLTRPDLVDEELLSTMRRAGCVRLEMSIETGSDGGRGRLEKGLSEASIVEGFRLARRAGMSTMAFVIMNVPGETERDLERTLELTMKVDPDFLQVSFLTPYPGTALRDWAEREGRITTDDWSRYGFLRDVVLRNDHLSEERIRAAYSHFIQRFYFRPRTLFKLARLVTGGTTHLRPLARTVALGLAGALVDRPGEDEGAS